MYSPPFYASSMHGYGVDYDAPRPPFVLAKMLWRSPLGVPLQSLWFLVSMLVRLLAGVFGFNAGIFAWDDEGPLPDQGPWRYRDVVYPGAEAPDDGRMGSDEYL